MKLLSIETAFNFASVALFADGQLIDSIVDDVPFRQTDKLATFVLDILARNKILFSEIDIVAVNIGPGSFTGIRIGMSYAYGIAAVSNIKIVGINSLEALAYNNTDMATNASTIITTIDAKREELYYASFDKDIKPIVEPCVIKEQDLANIVGQNSKVKCIHAGNNDVILPTAIDIGRTVIYKIMNNIIDINDIEFNRNVVQPCYVRDIIIS